MSLKYIEKSIKEYRGERDAKTKSVVDVKSIESISFAKSIHRKSLIT